MSPILRSDGEEDTAELGRLLAPLLATDDVVTLTGDLGAGKTCLVKGVASGLGVREVVTSPTFNIVLVHPGRLTLYHVDLYRLDVADQLTDIDFSGVLESGGVAFVEWGERFPGALPADHLAVSLTITGDYSRDLALTPGGARARVLADAWIAAAGGDAR
jgi:tRNA threonylcarbamoyladenosine biosynthesis protein TsaE